VSYKRGLAVLTGSVVAALVSYAATYPRFHHPQTAVPAAGAGASAVASGASVEATITTAFTPLPGHDDPLAWARLTDAQHVALAPFALEWDEFSIERRHKWLKIAARYPKMSPEAQKRLHERMAEWIGMTPEQRRVARENYQVSKQLPSQARQRAWKAYQELSPDQKARLAATERKRRTVVSAPPSGSNSEIREIERLVNERDKRRQGHPQAAVPASGASGTMMVPGAPDIPGAPGTTTAPAAALASAPAAASFVPATSAPVSPADAFKGS
jgi:hypothetical protein